MHGENKEKLKGMTQEEIDNSRFTIDLSSADLTSPVYDDDGIKIHNKVVPLTNFTKMNSVIKKSLEDYPRDFFLPQISVSYKPGDYIFGHLTEAQFKTHLKKITGKELHQTLLRKIFIHYWYNESIGIKTKKALALYMRHSVAVAASEYLKVNVPADKGKYTMVHMVEPKSLIVEEKERKPYFDPKEYGKKYRQGITKDKEGVEKVDTEVKEARNNKRKEKYAENKEKLLARKTLFYLNRGLTKQPMEKTIEKYGLEKKDGVWTSTKI
jgi:hypothetical protein